MARFPQSARIRKPSEYRHIYRYGRRVRGECFSLVYTPAAAGESRLGISIHGVKKAVRRNRIKRIIREFFRLHRDAVRPPVDVVFTIREGFAPDSPAEVREAVFRLVSSCPCGFTLDRDAEHK